MCSTNNSFLLPHWFVSPIVVLYVCSVPFSRVAFWIETCCITQPSHNDRREISFGLDLFIFWNSYHVFVFSSDCIQIINIKCVVCIECPKSATVFRFWLDVHTLDVYLHNRYNSLTCLLVTMIANKLGTSTDMCVFHQQQPTTLPIRQKESKDK